MNVAPPQDSPAIVVRCDDLQSAIDHYTGELGYRLEMIMPADDPRLALVTGHGRRVRLESSRPALPAPDSAQEFVITRLQQADAWNVGRAGMLYRDLLPGRLGGRYIASHIRIPQGGPVPDYVHYHQVRFQMIHCLRGWVRVVYEDQGPDFVMHAGDCVLQPPTIRHRVLEASPGLEVIEIGGPAEHATFREHEIGLPTGRLQTDRRYGGQRFVRHVAAEAAWQASPDAGFMFRDTGIGDATDGLASVRILRSALGTGNGNPAAQSHTLVHDGDLLFWQVLQGDVQLTSQALGMHTLHAGDSCAIPPGADYALSLIGECELLEVAVSRQADDLPIPETRG